MPENATGGPSPLPSSSESSVAATPGSLRELAGFFLRLGVTAFGGPAAHIAIMEDELVRRRGWLSRKRFLDLLGMSNLIPGPSSSELAIHIGYQRAGLAGLLVAGCCFILPAAVAVTGCAWAYVRFGHLPAAAALLYGVKPVVIAIILQALWGLGRTAIKTRLLYFVGAAAVALSYSGWHPLLVLLVAGTAVAGASLAVPILGRSRNSALIPLSFLGNLARAPRFFQAAGAAAASFAAPFSLGSLFFVFLKIGSVVFGSGYVLLAFLRADFVLHRGWLTDSQLIDAVAVGQITPGPVFTTATFIGYLLGGIRGAGVATVGIFIPAFLLVAASGPLVSVIRKSKTAAAFLDGVNVASLALMVVVTWQLARASIIDIETVLLAVMSLVALVRFRLNSAWLVLGGAIAGLATHGLITR